MRYMFKTRVHLSVMYISVYMLFNRLFINNISSEQNRMLHEGENTFEMKTVENHPDLMELDK